MASAGTVTVDFAAETAKFTAELQKVNSRLRNIEGGFKSMERVAKAALKVFSVGLVVNFAKQAANAADQLGKTADKIGVSTEALKSFQIAAGEAGVGLQQANKLLIEGQTRLGQAAAGTGEAAKFIKALGLNIEDLQKLSPDQLFRVYAESINGLSTRSEQLAAANALMGETAREAFTLIQAGSPALDDAAAFTERFGLALDRVDIKQIEQANDAIGRVATVSQAASQRIIAGIAPAVEYFAKQILDATGNTQGLQRAFERVSAVAIATFQVAANAVNVFVATTELAAAAAAKVTKEDSLLAKLLSTSPFALAAKAGNALREATGQTVLTAEEHLSRAEAALAKVKSIEQIQAEIIQALESSRLKAEQAVADQAAREAAARAGGLTLADPIGLNQEQRFEEANLAAKAAADAQKEIARELSTALIAEVERRNEAERQAAAFRVDINRRAEQAILETKVTTQNAALGLLQALGVKNKAFAIAAIVLEKAIAIQRLLVQNQIAAELAFASQLIPGVPTSLASATAAKAAVLAQGRIAAGLIAATGALQIADVASGGGRAPVGSALNPAFVASSPVGGGQDFGATSQNAVQVIIANNVGFDQRVMDEIIAGIREATDDRDVIIFGPESRQARELVTVNG